MYIVARDRVQPFATKDTSTIREIIHPQHSPARNQSLAEATLAPGRTTQAHFHTQSEEIYYILKGRAEIAIEEESSTLTAGEAVVIAPSARHQIRNIGEEELVFLCCCAPAYSHDDTTMCEALFKS
jgi:mannose-6-phosphate isomerase-like protein (cupin superfamily)